MQYSLNATEGGANCHEEKSGDWRGKVYPNGEFGFCRQKRVSVQGANRLPRTKEQQRAISLVHLLGLQTAIWVVTHERIAYRQMSLGEQSPSEHIDLTMVLNCPKKPYGSHGITRHGRRTVRNAAYILQTEYTKDRLSFLTVTLPALSLDHWRGVGRHWSEIRKSFYQGLQYRLRRARLPEHIVGVVEIQSERFERDRVPGLHIHCCFVGRFRGSGWELRWDDIRQLWRNCIENALGEDLSQYDWNKVENIRMVRKNASAYLGKYMSKGSEIVQKWQEYMPDIPHPKQWYTCTRELSKLIKTKIKVLRGDRAKLLAIMSVENWESCVKCVRLKTLKNKMGFSYTIAGGGSLTRGGKNLLGV